MNKGLSVSDAAYRAQEAAVKRHMDAGRQRTLTVEEARGSLEKQARAKAYWLTKHSDGRDKRPDTDIEARRLEIAVLLQVADRLRKPEAGDVSRDG